VRDDDTQLDRLMAGGNLSGGQYDRIEQRILAEVARTEPGARARWLPRVSLGLGLMSAAAAVVIGLSRSAPPEFAQKGTHGAAVGVLDVGCGGARAHVCAHGDTLVFTVNSAVGSGYLGAYAEKEGAPPHERIWYFPDQDSPGPLVPPGSGTVAVAEGVRIGPEHVSGRYVVTLWLSAEPLRQAHVDQQTLDGLAVRSTVTIEIGE
jgi:hypothetical protein